MPEHTASLKRNHPLPLYSQMKNALQRQILAGELRSQQQLPSEAELMEQYAVSRITVRQALAGLEQEHLIVKVPGKGSFVTEHKPFQELGRLQGFSEAMAPYGHATRNLLLDIHTQPASALVAQRLALFEGDPVVIIRRVRYLNQQPLSLDLTYLPQTIGARLHPEQLRQRDIFLLLEQEIGIALGHADLSLDATLATAEQAMHLGLIGGEPLLRIERLTYDQQGRPLDFEYLYCRVDNFQYRLRIQRQPAAGDQLSWKTTS